MPDYLKNKKLLVTVGHPMEFYQGSRFDHFGNVLQVTFNNKHTFCTTEKSDRSLLSGIGLMNEFDIDLPQGYNETGVGEYFHKIGVGDLLKQDEQAYNFFRNYPIRNLDYILEKEEEDILLYKVKSSNLKSICVDYQKIISIHDNELLIEYFLVNKDTKPLKTSEYTHNFIAINGAELDQDYLLEFNFKLNDGNFEAVHNIDQYLKIHDRSINFKATPDGDIFIRKLNGTQIGSWWQLTNTKLGVGVREEVSFESNLVNLWGNAHVISPELFFQVELPAGEEVHWWRKYTFFEMK
ncbi:MAG: hypothetical protein ACERKD_15970 [Prolixibacteraceae bacterium]